MRRFLAMLPLALLAACSPASPSPDQKPPQPKATATATARSTPDNAELGSPLWYEWVDERLHISDDGHGPDRGSAEWNSAVQHKLGQEAPQSQPGSPQWQQAVDALLRTRPAM
ncbi:hypothetical protein DyAD56_06085 [Dyella sp. AD56]|uniref:hypothetical protein n=1 Tax=Dyella sp. AD56 TaxID=1528744 RepID=UPI000C827CB2|nr:hypothetical protein [Dyella sp. AD56]PMQ06203.1 hypothetical protein DyAD56_06085 [Dyella sp. AD56]